MIEIEKKLRYRRFSMNLQNFVEHRFNITLSNDFF